MKFKIDENLPVELAHDIRIAGHEAETVTDEGLTGFTDSIILETARNEEFVFLTLDKGIGDIRNYPPEQHHGIVLFRPLTIGRGTVLEFVRRNLEILYSMDLNGHLVVITGSGMRIR